jgi:hypothetical protein
MRKLAIVAVALGAITAASVAPAEARWRGHGFHGGGPAIGFGLAAGALALGAAAASPYYYSPGYYPEPYAYGGPVYYRPRYRPYYGPYGYW